jgi:hypothetical protein
MIIVRHSVCNGLKKRVLFWKFSGFDEPRVYKRSVVYETPQRSATTHEPWMRTGKAKTKLNALNRHSRFTTHSRLQPMFGLTERDSR